MSFSNLTFLFYFLPAFVLLYYLLPPRARSAFLFLGSLGFYAYGAGAKSAGLLLTCVVFHFFLAHRIEWTASLARRAYLAVCLILDVGVLLLFKYAGLFDRLSGAALTQNPFLAALPLGLSFYLFQSMAYALDVYRGKTLAQRSFWEYAAFVTAFPQLIMGPILRHDTWKSPRMSRFSRTALELGFSLFAVGLCCKVLIADRLAPLWASLERIGFASLSTPLAWLGAFGYSLQLYFDFQGYSLMAMGLGQMLGLSIPRNFDNPYCARSVSEFYRCWHITLGLWFRDYVYIPLGGSRSGALRTVIALSVVWLLTGMWHGATANFLLWGAALLLLILLEKFCIGGFLKRHRVLSHLYLLAVIPPSWVIFRITDLAELRVYLSRLFPFFGGSSAVFSGDFLKYLLQYRWVFAAAILLCLPCLRRFYERRRGSALIWLPLLCLFWLCIYFISVSSGNAFLYFSF